MRPGRTRAGYPYRAAPYTKPYERFNEAGAHAPRILGDPPQLATERLAASMRPGRTRPGYDGVEKVLDLSEIASMRPGRTRPGYHDCCWRSILYSRCFNEAGAHAPRIPGGHQPSRCRSLPASMRPGRTRPGYTRPCGPSPGRSRASMRPGRTRPGYRSLPRIGSGSHRFNEAGAHAPRIRHQSALAFRAGASFNEAGAHAPRILDRSDLIVVGRVYASMRPGRTRPGYSAAACRASCPARRFNEAGAHAPRIRSD